MARNILGIEATEYYQVFPDKDYGITDQRLSSVQPQTLNDIVIQPTSLGDFVKARDLIYIYPFLAGSENLNPSLITGKNMKLRFMYFLPGRGFKQENLVFFFDPSDNTNQKIVDKINLKIQEVSLDSYFVASLFDSDTKLRIQAQAQSCNVMELGSSLVGAPEKGSKGIHIYLNPIKNFLDTVNIETVPYYISDDTDNIDYLALKGLDFELMRYMGNSTSSSIRFSTASVEYKGAGKFAKQIEYTTSEASIEVNDITFNYENLDRIKGWTKTSGSFFSGKSGATKYTLSEDIRRKTFSVLGLARVNEDMDLLSISSSKCVAPNIKVKMGKEFRTHPDTFRLLKGDDKVVMKVITISKDSLYTFDERYLITSSGDNLVDSNGDKFVVGGY